MSLFAGKSIDFLRHSRWFLVLSGLLMVASIVSLIAKGGPRYGIEFDGGVVMEAQLDAAPEVAGLRAEVAREAPGASVVAGSTGHRPAVWITAPLPEKSDIGETRAALVKALDTGGVPYAVRSFEAIGPQMGAELRKQALLAAVLASLGMLGYLAWRFRFLYGAAAVIAVVHDVLITLGVFSFTNQEVTLSVTAALLTLIGYSMNDTIVVFDRLRDNLAHSGSEPVASVVNRSIQQTLRRTLLTSGLTLLAVLALLAYGGRVLHGFALALAVGIVVGTYSSIFVATPIVAWWPRQAAGRAQ